MSRTFISLKHSFDIDGAQDVPIEDQQFSRSSGTLWSFTSRDGAVDRRPILGGIRLAGTWVKVSSATGPESE